jgi:hypothetical protein
MSAREPAHDGPTWPIGTCMGGRRGLPLATDAAQARRTLKVHLAGYVFLAALVGACGSDAGRHVERFVGSVVERLG